MKAKHALFLLALGYCIDFIAYICRILHLSFSANLLLAASALKILGVILFLYKVLTYPRLKEFLNK